MKKIKDQFKNEFQSLTLEGDSFYIDDAAEKPLGLVPYGEPVQEVIPEELGTTIEGETVVVADGDANKEVKDVIYGMSKQETTEGYNELDLSDFKIYYIPNGTVALNKNGSLNFSEELSYACLQIKPITLKANTEYTLVRNFSGDYNTWLSPTADGGSEQLGINYGQTFKTVTFTEDVTLNYIRGAFLKGDNYFWLYEGNYTVSKPYEPYTNGASPNTEYKQDIEVIEAYNKLNPDNLSLFNSNKYIQTKTRIDVMPNTEYSIVSNKGFTDMSVNAYSDDTNNEKLTYTTTIKGDRRYYTFTTKADTKTLYIYVGQDTEYATLEEYLKSLELMLQKGTADLPYLPYGHIGLVQRGKNLIDFSKSSLVTLENNILTIKASNAWGGSSEYNVLDILKRYIGKKITFSCKSFDFSKTNGGYVQLTYVKAGTAKYHQLMQTSGKINPFTIPEDVSDITHAFVKIYVNNTNTSGTEYSLAIEEPMLIFEDENTNGLYEPYIEPKTIPINLNGNSIAKVGEIADLLKIGVDGRVEIKKKNIKIILDGVDNKLINKSVTTNNNQFRTKAYTNLKQPENNNYAVDLFCNYFKSFSANKIYSGSVKEGIAIANGGDINLGFGIDSEINTLELANAWLQEHNVEIIASLQEQYYETIPLPSIEPITLFKGTNVFELLTHLGTTMALTYDYVTPSPSIDRPSEILTVKGSYDTEKVNENFIDISRIKNLGSSSNGGITLSPNQDNGLNFVGTATEPIVNIWYKGNYSTYNNFTDWENFDKSKILFVLLPNIEYTLSDIAIFYVTEDGEKASTELSVGQKITKTFTKKLYVVATRGVRCSKGTTYNTVIYPSIIRGKDMEYTPHQSSTLPLTLTKELLGEIVTLTEEEAKQLSLDGAGKYRRTDYGRYVCTGNETIIRNTALATNTYRFAIISIKAKPNITNNTLANIYSNLFVADASNRNYSNVECITVDINGFPVVYSDLTKYYTLDEFKVLLKEWYDNGKPLEFIYELANPTYEKITDKTELEQLSAYDKQIAFFGINNINTFSTDDLEKAPLKLKVTYDKSNRIALQE